MIDKMDIRIVELDLKRDEEWVIYYTNFIRNCNTSFLNDKWMLDNPYKLAIFLRIYKDLFEGGHTIYDIGGGISSLSRLLGLKNEYYLVDPLSSVKANGNLEEFISNANIHFLQDDWLKFQDTRFERNSIVIANDIFPNIDQRLPLFLRLAKERKFRFRITLTWYSFPKYYEVKRIDAEEHLMLMQYDEVQLQRVLFDVFPNLDANEVLTKRNESFFANGRNICILENF